MKLYKFEELKVSEIFEKLRTEVSQLLPFARIEHIGASSIPGSISKGDLDVFVGVDADQFQNSLDILKTIGYQEKQGTFRSDDLCMLITDKYHHDVAIQLVRNGSEFEDFLRFRDALRANKNLVDQYNQIKREAVSLPENEYRSKKAIFIQSVLGKL